MTTAVRAVMNTDLLTVDPDTVTTEAVRLMVRRHVGSALVLDQGVLVGIFTERDILRAFDELTADTARLAPVSRTMTPDPSTVGPDASIGEALDQMLEGGFRHLPVMDDRTLVGIVSMRDLASSISKR
jgi:CBS domain-containing protein